MATTPAALRDWLIGQVSARTGTPPSEIDDREPFSLYGLDSAGAAAIAGELQDLHRKDRAHGSSIQQPDGWQDRHPARRIQGQGGGAAFPQPHCRRSIR